MRKAFLYLLIVLLTALPASAAKTVGKAQPKAPSESSRLFVPFGPYPRPMPHPITVGLLVRVPVAYFAVWNPGAVFIDNAPVYSIKPRQVYSIRDGQISDLSGGPSFNLPLGKRAVIASADRAGEYYFWTANRWYRGSLEIINYGSVFTAVNVLDLESYLFGVVPSEMPANWHLEALKAQAVAARSYAVAHMGSGSKWKRSEGFDIVPDVRDQAYKGLAKEALSARQAVLGTLGQVLKDSNRVKPGFYRATVGDTREENLNVRQTSVPSSTLEKLVGVPNIVGVTVKKWDIYGNATHLQILGKNKNTEVSGIALAQRLGFTTAGILDVNEQGDNWVFEYRGPGNGSRGLSQHGAQKLASAGWSYFLILQQYYQDADGVLRLESINQPGRYMLSYPVIPRQPVKPAMAPATTPPAKAAKKPALSPAAAQASELSDGPLFARPGGNKQVKPPARGTKQPVKEENQGTPADDGLTIEMAE